MSARVWKSPTRRAFVAMIGAAAAALGIQRVVPVPEDRDPDLAPEAPKPRWIGHF